MAKRPRPAWRRGLFIAEHPSLAADGPSRARTRFETAAENTTTNAQDPNTGERGYTEVRYVEDFYLAALEGTDDE